MLTAIIVQLDKTDNSSSSNASLKNKEVQVNPNNPLHVIVPGEHVAPVTNNNPQSGIKDSVLWLLPLKENSSQTPVAQIKGF